MSLMHHAHILLNNGVAELTIPLTNELSELIILFLKINQIYNYSVIYINIINIILYILILYIFIYIYIYIIYFTNIAVNTS